MSLLQAFIIVHLLLFVVVRSSMKKKLNFVKMKLVKLKMMSLLMSMADLIVNMRCCRFVCFLKMIIGASVKFEVVVFIMVVMM